MANIDYRVNLSAAMFPMTVAKAGRNVIIPGPDHNFDRRVDAPGDTQRGSVGIPQIIYAENILPTPDGLQSVGFKPRTAISLAASTIAAVVPVKVATVVTTEEVVTGDAITFTDAGDQIEVWSTSGEEYALDAASYVDEISSDGNPQPSYRLVSWYSQSSGDAAGPLGAAWLYKAFTPGDPDNCGFEFDFEFMGFETKKIAAGIFTSAAGAGLKVIIDNESVTETVTLAVTSDKEGLSDVTVLDTQVVTAFAVATTYRIEVALVRVSGNTRDVTVLVKDSGGTTLYTLTGTYTVAIGTHCGVLMRAVDNAVESGIFVDNLEVSGDAPQTTETYTEYTGLTSAYIAFRENDTAVWSYDLDTWDNYVVNVPGGFESPASPNKVSVANVRGVTYICIREAGDTTKIYTAAVDTGTNEIDLTDITTTIDGTLPNGYSIDSILSIASSYNYLVLCTGGTILWSSTTTPTDFAPSLVSGAGNEVPGNLKGDIAFLREHVSGFFIYSTKNVVFAQYTGNARYPWKFREVGGSGGFNLSTQVSGDTNSAVQYGVNNTRFIQILSPDSAEVVAPEVTDFIERNTRWDIFNSSTYAFSLSDATFSLLPETKVSTWFVLDRYLMLPYGMSDAATNLQWTFVIVYDNLLKRYGKLKVTFDFCLSDEEDMFFINRLTGAISRLYFDIHDQSLSGTTYQHNGVVVLGKFQYVRSRWLSLERIDVETVQDRDIVVIADRQFACRILGTLDGKTFESAVTPYNNTPTASKKTVQFLAHKSYQNFALAFKGAFDMNSLQIQFHPEGDD